MEKWIENNLDEIVDNFMELRHEDIRKLIIHEINRKNSKFSLLFKQFIKKEFYYL